MNMLMMDLHIHSTASDGSLSPEEILREACSLGVSPVSITDHDTVAAYVELDSAKPASGIIPGVELSAEFAGGTLHILGYGIDPFDENLSGALGELQRFRLDRNRRIIAAMGRIGFDITFEEVLLEAGGELIGRPHFASLMVKKGYVKTFREAFDRYLKKGAPLYMDKKRLLPGEAIGLIRKAGGIAVMAHPWQTGLDRAGVRALVVSLREYGLEGLEAFYSQHSEEQTEICLGFAREFGLIVTAGSDFHGDIKPEIPLGMRVPLDGLLTFFGALRIKSPDACS